MVHETAGHIAHTLCGRHVLLRLITRQIRGRITRLSPADLSCWENGVRAAIAGLDSFAGHAGLVLSDELLHDIVTTNANRFIGSTGGLPV
jgi:hypothetical protein